MKFIYKILIIFYTVITNNYVLAQSTDDQFDASKTTYSALLCEIKQTSGYESEPNLKSEIIKQVCDQLINDVHVSLHKKEFYCIQNINVELECFSEIINKTSENINKIISNEYENYLSTGQFNNAQNLVESYKLSDETQIQFWLNQIQEYAQEKIINLGQTYKALLTLCPDLANQQKNSAFNIINSFSEETLLHKILKENFTKAHKSSNLLIPLNSIPEAEDYETPKGSPNFKRKSDELDSSSYSRNIKEKNAKLPKYDWFNEDSEE